VYKRQDYDCTCNDWANMCKHITAVLYGVGTRLDSDPLIFFNMRGIDVREFINNVVDGKIETMLSNMNKETPRIYTNVNLPEVFGMEVTAMPVMLPASIADTATEQEASPTETAAETLATEFEPEEAATGKAEEYNAAGEPSKKDIHVKKNRDFMEDERSMLMYQINMPSQMQKRPRLERNSSPQLMKNYSISKLKMPF